VVTEHGAVPRRLLLGAALLAVAIAVALALHQRGGDDAAGDPAGEPLASHGQYDGADPALVAAAEQAAADGDTRTSDLLTRLDGVPTGIWLTPERYPTPAAAAGFVGAVAGAAQGKDQTPVFVVYGVPGRDCTGGESSGGLSPEDYLPWVRAIAAAAGDTSVAVLEPDALAGAVQCGIVDARVALLGQAVDALRDAGVTTYVDAGHSSWVPADQIAPLLKRVGVETVRGFTTNVSNYQPTAAETAYAQSLSALLGGAHYLIDTGRNGAGAAVTDWCNPSSQALGHAPGTVDDGTGLDGYLWIKPPGESDGLCNGGPSAGQVWPRRAVDLATAAGW
jgi:endoglucanase